MTRNDIFRLAAALLAISLTASSGASLCCAQDDSPEGNYREKVVYSGPDVIFRQIDEHTWEGNGHLCYNESIYIVEGSERALLIDAGTKIANLDEARDVVAASFELKHYEPTAQRDDWDRAYEKFMKLQ